MTNQTTERLLERNESLDEWFEKNKSRLTQVRKKRKSIQGAPCAVGGTKTKHNERENRLSYLGREEKTIFMTEINKETGHPFLQLGRIEARGRNHFTRNAPSARRFMRDIQQGIIKVREIYPAPYPAIHYRRGRGGFVCFEDPLVATKKYDDTKADVESVIILDGETTDSLKMPTRREIQDFFESYREIRRNNRYQNSAERKFLLQEINKLEAKLDEFTLNPKELQLLKEDSQNSKLKRYIEQALSVQEQERGLNIDKTGYYYLFIGDSVVSRFEGGNEFSIMRTPTKSDPFQLVPGHTPMNLSQAMFILNIQPGDFLDGNGCKISGEQLEQAQEYFNLVETGEQLLPDGKKDRGYKIKHKKRKPSNYQSSPQQIRTWGQKFLEGEQPEEIINGQFFATGELSKAFMFGDTVIVESNLEGRATYVIDKAGFNQLRGMTKEEIRSENPEGYRGRAIHSGKEDKHKIEWKNSILGYINREKLIKKHTPRDREFNRYSSRGHQEIVGKLLRDSTIIEPGLELIGSEYRFEDGWARADLVYLDGDGNLLSVEVKPYAKNGDEFDNALKGIEQTAGYSAAIRVSLDYHEKQCPNCPLWKNKPEVRGMLVGYDICDNAKGALEKEGLEYKEIK